MLAEMVNHVVGVDPDRDWITAAVVDSATAGVVATARFAANGSGYREAMAWADEYSTDTERAWAVEGTSSYGRGIAAALANSGEWVIEFDRAKEKAQRRSQDRHPGCGSSRPRDSGPGQVGVATHPRRGP